MNKTEILLGNGAIALGLLEAGCQVIASYPGTPSSEILPEAVRLIKAEGLSTYTEWSTNEKVALDTAFAAAVAGKRASCVMKQVGLNVAADSLMSSAYLGTRGGLVIVSCDDPGPHSSQTEQDTRIMARLAKVPVFDPSNPQEARAMAKEAMKLSEKYKVPVILRPGIRVCHAKQNLQWGGIEDYEQKASFERNPSRWAATPKFRYLLHGELNKKLTEISNLFESLTDFNHHDLKKGVSYPLGVVAGGVPFAVLMDIFNEENRTDIPVLKLGTPYPFPEKLAEEFLDACEKVIVLEETDTFIEYLLRDKHKVLGRLSGHIPSEGELVPEVIHQCVSQTLKELDLRPLMEIAVDKTTSLVKSLNLPIRKPTLCPGCPHRASFFAIRKGRPKAIFTSDIGCYTLGLNLGGVDTCLDMGAAITMASGFYHAFAQDDIKQPIVATMGDSTFFHSGSAGLINAVYNDARFILVLLDNQVTAMTGMQPTPGLGIRADGSKGKVVTLEQAVKGCGVKFMEVVDPYEIDGLRKAMKKATDYVQSPDGGIAVIISRHPCVIAYRNEDVSEKKPVEITDDCKACGYCGKRFECPAMSLDPDIGHTVINRQICADCGICAQICPNKAIEEKEVSK